jgi:outer membrane protein OmpA-like peptidoglycan-associated protein
VGIVVAPPDVLFDPGSTSISKGAQSRLQRLADSVRERTDLEVVLRGHADTSPREKDAFAISEKRAHEVRAFLADEGVPWRRMRIVGLGAARPVASNDSASGRQRNRRVEIMLREVERS